MGKSKYKSRQAMALGYISIACLSILIIVFSIYSMDKVSAESDHITQKIVPAKMFSMQILTALIDQQTGIRAYIISGKKDFLDSYYLGNKELEGYSDYINNLEKVGIDGYTANQLNQKIKTIQIYFKEQIRLVDDGNLQKAVSNLSQGKILVDEFRTIDTMLIDKIDLQINRSSEYTANTRIIHKYLLIFLGVLLVVGNFIFIKHILNDINEEVDKKNQLNRELQKLIISQEEFIMNISHELKTPLNVIYSAVQLFEMYCHNGSLDERHEAIVTNIDSMKLNSYRLEKLINNIVDSSKVKAGCFQLNLTNNNIVVVIEDIIIAATNFIDCKGLNIIFDTNIEEKIIACDVENIERVMLNLISNAIKFSEKGKEIFVQIKEKNEFIQISVKDNGIGMADSHMDVIFDRFKQVNRSLSRNAEGTGIGLNLTKSIIELHKGKIFVESELGIGSKFTFTLPSIIVIEENLVPNNTFENKNELMQLEFSDIYL
ncbi:MAG TPA: ATP-binding protein [Clostridium sp.]|uniref:ATP-binding protein n=1 Tax=Clostridium sp. TaxID=1506 RepID=UPI002F94ACC5